MNTGRIKVATRDGVDLPPWQYTCPCGDITEEWQATATSWLFPHHVHTAVGGKTDWDPERRLLCVCGLDVTAPMTLFSSDCPIVRAAWNAAVDAAIQQVPPETEDEDSARLATRTASPRPKIWGSIIGNAVAVEQLREAITAAQVRSAPMAHTLIFGPPGMGKTTLAGLVAQDLGGGFIATTASTLETSENVIRLLWRLNAEYERTGRYSVLFIDEIHMLGQGKGRAAVDQEAVYPLLEDWVYPHNMQRKIIADADGTEYVLTDSSVRVYPFTCIGATTEPGMLSQALLRRFLVHVELEPYTEDDIAKIIGVAAGILDWPLEPEAAVELSKYARRNPGRAYQLLTAAKNRADATGRDSVTVDVANEVVARMKLYPLGLNETDVRILKILADRAPKGVGAGELSRAVGISQGQFTQMVEPYLRLLGFLETLTRRVIRPEGLVYLSRLGKLDTSRPEIRAAVEMATR